MAQLAVPEHDRPVRSLAARARPSRLNARVLPEGVGGRFPSQLRVASASRHAGLST
jgi:hypothetical protein